jgi:hypothetical protein
VYNMYVVCCFIGALCCNGQFRGSIPPQVLSLKSHHKELVGALEYLRVTYFFQVGQTHIPKLNSIAYFEVAKQFIGKNKAKIKQIS